MFPGLILCVGPVDVLEYNLGKMRLYPYRKQAALDCAIFSRGTPRFDVLMRVCKRSFALDPCQQFLQIANWTH